MKHTLKSLLITSILTLPTVLGSGGQPPLLDIDIEAITNFINGNKEIPEDQKKVILNGVSQNATVEDIRKATDVLRKFGNMLSKNEAIENTYYTTAAELYKRISTRDDATVGKIQWAADGLCNLKYYIFLAKLYKTATSEPETPEGFLRAENGLHKLANLYPKDSREQTACNRMLTKVRQSLRNLLEQQ